MLRFGAMRDLFVGILLDIYVSGHRKAYSLLSPSGHRKAYSLLSPIFLWIFGISSQFLHPLLLYTR